MENTMTIDARTAEEKQREAIGLIVNCLIAVGVASGMGDQFNKDLWRAYELIGGNKLDLLKLVGSVP